MPTRILGIDPGLRVTGYGIVESQRRSPKICEAGVIRSQSSDATPDLAVRLTHIHDALLEIIDQFEPDVMVIEQLYSHYKHPRTAILMGHARGVALLAAAQRKLQLVHYSATRIKKTITGNGRAPKDQVQRTIQKELGLAQAPEPSDVADALAAALCHYYVQKIPE